MAPVEPRSMPAARRTHVAYGPSRRAGMTPTMLRWRLVTSLRAPKLLPG